MPHTVGGLTLPEPEPEFDGVLDPALAVLGQAIPAVLRFWFTDAFAVFANGIDLIASVNYFDPLAVYDGNGAIQPDDAALPGLFLFSRTTGSSQIGSDMTEHGRDISIAWMAPSRQDRDNSTIDSLFGPFSAAIAAIVQLERHPSWVSDSDATITGDDDPLTVIQKTIAQARGSNIPDACGFSQWDQPKRDAVTRFHMSLSSTLLPKRYDGFLARIHVRELFRVDPANLGYVKTAISATVSTVGSSPPVNLGFTVPPDP